MNTEPYALPLATVLASPRRLPSAAVNVNARNAIIQFNLQQSDHDSTKTWGQLKELVVRQYYPIATIELHENIIDCKFLTDKNGARPLIHIINSKNNMAALIILKSCIGYRKNSSSYKRLADLIADKPMVYALHVRPLLYFFMAVLDFGECLDPLAIVNADVSKYLHDTNIKANKFGVWSQEYVLARVRDQETHANLWKPTEKKMVAGLCYPVARILSLIVQDFSHSRKKLYLVDAEKTALFQKTDMNAQVRNLFRAQVGANAALLF